MINFLNKNHQLLHAIEKQDVSKIEKILSKSIDVNKTDKNGYTPLVHSLETENIEIIRILLDSGANVNVKFDSGYTPILYAAQYGLTDLVDVLIEYKADVNVKTKSKMTALMFAAKNGTYKIVRELLNNGASINEISNKKLTAMDYAMKNKDYNTISVLKNHHAKPFAFLEPDYHNKAKRKKEEKFAKKENIISKSDMDMEGYRLMSRFQCKKFTNRIDALKYVYMAILSNTQDARVLLKTPNQNLEHYQSIISKITDAMSVSFINGQEVMINKGSSALNKNLLLPKTITGVGLELYKQLFEKSIYRTAISKINILICDNGNQQNADIRVYICGK